MLTLNLAFLTPKRHFLIRKDIYRCISWNSPISGVGCTLVQEPPKRWKNAIEDVYVGCLPESDPLCKCYETWHGGSCRVRNRSDRCWSTPVNRFRCVATPKLSPCHRQGPSGCSRYRGNAWLDSPSRIMRKKCEIMCELCTKNGKLCTNYALLLSYLSVPWRVLGLLYLVSLQNNPHSTCFNVYSE